MLLLAGAAASAQNTTREEKDNSSSKGTTCKILVIPFNPKMYLSDVDKKLGTENKMNFNQLRAAFRAGLDYKVASQLKSVNTTYSLLTDSVKNKKDLEMIYNSVGYDYDKPNPEGAVSKNPTAQKEQPKIQNGQLVVEMNDEFRFMNAKITNPKLVPYLQEKFKADVYVFINELDIKKNEGSYDITTDTYQRDVIVHYTVFDKSGKRINAGVATSTFSSTVNDTKSIINSAFSSIAKTISDRVIKSAPYVSSAPVPNNSTTPAPNNQVKQK